MRAPNFFVKCSTWITGSILVALNFTSQARSQEIRILAYGDSLTAGYRLPPEQSYPAQLEKLLKEEGYAVHIVNGGVSGDTSAQALARVSWNLQKSGPFDWVLLSIGANDGLRRMPLDALEKNLTDMIQLFEKAGARVVLLGQKLPTNFEGLYRKRFESLYKRLAKKKHLPFLPFILEGVATEHRLHIEDQMHPNAQGYRIIAKHVADLIRPFLKTKKTLPGENL